jgi:ribosomal protein S18 acetylase RimI-like enzyme
MRKAFIHRENGEIVASLILYRVGLPSRYLGVIEEVFVKEEYRRRGLATKLMKQALNHAKKIGLDCVELNVNKDALYLIEFYKKLGFYDRNNTSMRYPIKKLFKNGKI